MDGYENQDELYGQKEPNPQDESKPSQYYAYGEAESSGTYTEPVYGEGDETNGWYRAYEETPKPRKEGSGFAKKLVKCAAFALTFGLVAGLAFAGTTYFFRNVTGEDRLSAKEEKKASGGDLHIIDATEAADPISGSAKAGSASSAEGAVTDVSDIAEQAMPSIVSITTIARTQVPSFFFGEMEEYENEGCGSGIIVSQDEENLYIATNNHVVEGAQTLTVLFADETTVDARIKGVDASSDLAVIAVALKDIEEETKKNIRVASFGDSSALKIGHTAIAIGNALGYGQSVTTGVISAVNREVTVTNETDGSATTNELIQTSAAINPGNSGGALLNADGEVIGINSSKYSDTQVEGMGFAIPMATVKPIVEDLIANGKTTISGTPYLGIYGEDVSQEVSERYNMPDGVYVTQVIEGSGAAAAGITAGNFITKVDDTPVSSMEELKSCISAHKVGDTVMVTVQIANSGTYLEKQVPVTLTANTY